MIYGVPELSVPIMDYIDYIYIYIYDGHYQLPMPVAPLTKLFFEFSGLCAAGSVAAGLGVWRLTSGLIALSGRWLVSGRPRLRRPVLQISARPLGRQAIASRRWFFSLLVASMPSAASRRSLTSTQQPADSRQLVTSRRPFASRLVSSIRPVASRWLVVLGWRVGFKRPRAFWVADGFSAANILQ